MRTVPVILRPPLWQRAMPAAALLVLAAMAAAYGLDRGGWWLPLGFAAAAIGMVGVARGWTLRVEARPDELVLVNWFQVVRLPWASVARCGHDTDGLWIRKDDGREIRASSFHYGPTTLTFARVPASAAADRLDRIRKQRRRQP